jgi:hypothetical protein
MLAGREIAGRLSSTSVKSFVDDTHWRSVW